MQDVIGIPVYKCSQCENVRDDVDLVYTTPYTGKRRRRKRLCCDCIEKVKVKRMKQSGKTL